MEIKLNQKLYQLAKALPVPLYAVGGVVRNYLIDQSIADDVDLAAPLDADEFAERAKELGFIIQATYAKTGTVLFTDGQKSYEYTRFRTDSYRGGEHSPCSVNATDDILLDAKRRDFKCNAIYYDLKNQRIVDPLGGVKDVENGVLDTVVDAEQVFMHDGLRIMRLARFCGQLNFKSTTSVLNAAKKYTLNLRDVSVERIFSELRQILVADCKYPFSDKSGHYAALKILDEIGALDVVIPELALGRGMQQRKDYHDHDVLEHSLRTVLYSPPQIRLAALLHDVGKPYCMKNMGKYYGHENEGQRIAGDILNRLRADNRTLRRVKALTRLHMIDIDGKMRESKIKRLIIENQDLFFDLLALKRADYTACKDQEGEPIAVEKFERIYSQMKGDGTPFNLGELKLDATSLMEIGYSGKEIGKALEKLFWAAVDNPMLNDRERLKLMARKNFKG